jgi:putative ABC transport system permease protein
LVKILVDNKPSSKSIKFNAMIFYTIRNFLLYLLRNKLYTLVTLSGFAISITFVLLLSIYINKELSVDQFHDKKDRIFRLARDGGATFAPPVGDDIMNQYPEVESYTRYYTSSYNMEIPGGQKVRFKAYMVDSSFFNIFSFPLQQGDPGHVLSAGNSVVLSASFAGKNFENVDPMGMAVSIGDRSFIVTGIAEDMPENTHFPRCDVFLNFPLLFEFWGWPEGLTSYGNSSFGLYFLARENSDLPSKGPQILEKYKEEYWIFSRGYSDTLFFEPLTDTYYSSLGGADIKRNSRTTVTIFASIALLILIIAIINYINLSVAQSGFRSREIAIRKLLGSPKGALFAQHIIESVILASMATFLAIILALYIEKFFNAQMGTNLELANQFTPSFILFLVALTVIIGGISGISPALLSKRYNPIDVVKGKMAKSTKTTYSKVLISFQYGIAIILLIGSWTITRQSKFMRNYDLGFNTESIFHMQNTIEPVRKTAFREQLMAVPGVAGVSFCAGTPIDGGNNQSFNYNDKPMSFQEFRVDTAFFGLLGINTYATDVAYSSDGIWLNRTAVRMLELGDEPYSFKYYDEEFPVLGVIDDFNFRSLHTGIGPAIIRQLPETGYPWSILVKIDSPDLAGVVSQIREVQSSFTGGIPMEYGFIDDTINRWYLKESRQANLLGAFTLLSIIISTMGIFAMSIYYIQLKIKEIGIRKVNGAMTWQVMGMLNKDFIKWVAFAFVLAAPVAWYAMNRWLQNYPYRIELSWWIFALAGIITAGIALLSVSWQSWRAANRNPVETLRYE